MYFLIWFYNTYNNDKSSFNETLDEIGNMAKLYLAEDSCEAEEPKDDCCRSSRKKNDEPSKKVRKYRNLFDFANTNCDN